MAFWLADRPLLANNEAKRLHVNEFLHFLQHSSLHTAKNNEECFETKRLQSLTRRERERERDLSLKGMELADGCATPRAVFEGNTPPPLL